MRLAPFVIALIATPIGLAAQTTYVVPATHPTIQDAINATINGDTVLVAPGTYNENISLLGKDITLEGLSGAAATTIVGTGVGATVLFPAGSTRQCVMRGLTVTGGFITGGGTTGTGGGIRVQSSTPTIVSCVVTGNTADGYGGGIGVTGNNAGPLIQYCTISGNNAAGFSYASGGGIAVNSATSPGLATEIRNCVIADNTSASRGGGFFTAYSAGVVVDSCRITRNTTLAASGNLTGGGGVFVSLNSVGMVSNCRIWQNVSNTDGGGIKWFNVTAGAFVNNTIVDNVGGGAAGTANTGAGGTNVYCDLTNCIVWQNGVGAEFNFTGLGVGGVAPSVNVNHSLVTGGYAGTGNLSVSPQLLNSGSGNHRLAPTSPCIDAGSSSIATVPSFDFEGDARPLGGNVDIGADEFDAGSPLLFSDIATLSSAAPAPMTYSLTNAAPNGLFGLFFSLSGTEPGTFLFGQNVPLNPDGLTSAVLLVGALDGAGNGSMGLFLSVPPALVGMTLSSCALTIGGTIAFTNDENVRLVP